MLTPLLLEVQPPTSAQGQILQASWGCPFSLCHFRLCHVLHELDLLLWPLKGPCVHPLFKKVIELLLLYIFSSIDFAFAALAEV